MRKLFTSLLLLVTAASCADDPTTEGPATGGDIRFSGSAKITAMESGAAPIPFTWETDTDRIGLFSTKGDRTIFANVYYAAQNMGEVVSFISPASKNSVVWENAFEAQNFYAYYPYRSSFDDPTAIPASVKADQSGTLAKRDFVWYTASENRLPSEGEIPMDFQAAAGLLRCSVSSDQSLPGIRSFLLECADETLTFDGTVNLKDGTMEWTEEGSNRITVTFDRPVNLSAEPVTFYIALKPGLAGRKIEVTADTGKLQYSLGELIVPEEGIHAGSWSSVHLGTSLQPRDGINLSAQGPANTYLVNKPGTTYCFRADVKGNGVARNYAWTVEGQPVSKGYTDADLAIRPAEVKLLWYNTPMGESGWENVCPIDPESVLLDPVLNYVYFTTPAEFVNGNVGIAACDEAGEILWSWNIWAVEGYDYDLEARTVGRYTVMDRNLGAMAGKEAMQASDPREAALAFGHYYQWGRKDPFPAAPTYEKGGELAGGMKWGLPTHTPVKELQQNCSQYDWGASDMLYSANLASNAYGLATNLGEGYKLDDAVAATVKVPHKWVSNGSDNNCVAENNYTWHQRKPADNVEMTEWRYLWGSVDGSTSEKSIYDPCPPGWKVPTGDMYYYLLKEYENTEYGVYSPKYDLYIPNNGQRQAGFGGSQLSGVGDAIFLSTASVTDLHYPYRANPDSGVTSWNTYGGAGYQMRCVKEEVSATLAPQGKQSGHRAALMGDSITRTWRDRGRKEFFTENNYANFGVDGTTSQNMVGRFNSQVLADDPLCAVIACGTNDIADNDGYFRPIEDIFNNIRFMAERADEYGAKVIIGSAAPTRDMWWQSEEWKAKYNGDYVANRIVELNKLITAYVEAKGFVYADYYSVLADETGDLKEAYWWNGTDHVHPNYDAFIQMEGVLKPLIDAALYDPNVGSVGGNPIDDMDKWEWK